MSGMRANINFPLKISISMGRPRKWRILSAANARAAKRSKSLLPPTRFASPIEATVEIVEIDQPPVTVSDSEDIEVTKWTGGVNHDPETDNSDFSWDEMSTTEAEADESTDGSDDEFEEMAHLERAVQHELQLLHRPKLYDEIMKKHTPAEWKEAEKNRGFGYSGNSERSAQRNVQLARKKAKEDEKLRKSYVK
jgi:hypothetical protein